MVRVAAVLLAFVKAVLLNAGATVAAVGAAVNDDVGVDVDVD